METGRSIACPARPGQQAAHGLESPGSSLRIAMSDLPPFPVIATRILSLLSRNDVGMKPLSDLITADVSLSAEVIRLANSIEWGIRSEVTSLLHALALLGVDRVKGLAFTVAIRNYMSRALHYPSLRACWRHNLACALLCDELASQLLLDLPPAYTAGMLHDIGRLALCAAFPERYAGFAEQDEGDPSERLGRERAVFGIDHCELGLRLARQWGLPALFHPVIAEHHHVPAASPGPPRFDLTNLVRVSCLVADHLGFGATPGAAAEQMQIVESLPDWELGRLLCDWQAVQFRIALRVNALDPGLPV
jgi:putative nucleotidyltransferase with HDIG domain